MKGRSRLASGQGRNPRGRGSACGCTRAYDSRGDFEAQRLRSLAGPAARNVMSRKTVMPARSSATPLFGGSALIQFIVQRARQPLNQLPRRTVDFIGTVEEQITILHQAARSFDIIRIAKG